jgi:hypothetical protein
MEGLTGNGIFRRQYAAAVMPANSQNVAAFKLDTEGAKFAEIARQAVVSKGCDDLSLVLYQPFGFKGGDGQLTTRTIPAYAHGPAEPSVA